VLPTYGYARSYSGVSVASFQKQITVQEVTPKAARDRPVRGNAGGGRTAGSASPRRDDASGRAGG
jgi:hypothetical protein